MPYFNVWFREGDNFGTFSSDRDAISRDIIFTGSGGLALLGVTDEVIDEVIGYGTASDGISRQVRTDVLAGATAASNDDEAAWCDSTTVYDAASGAVGTPGAANEACAP